MPDSDSDSEIEVISAIPASSFAGPGRARSTLPTSVPKKSTAAPGSSSQTTQKQQTHDDSTAARKVHTVGAWAPAATASSSSSRPSSKATASVGAGSAAPRNHADVTGNGAVATTQARALNGAALPDRKGKGKAPPVEILTLDSTDDDEDSGSPIIVKRKPPRASMPSAASSVQSPKSKEPPRRHSLAHHKSSAAQVTAASSSSEPDPLMLAPRVTGSDRSTDRPANATASRPLGGDSARDTVVRKRTTARKSTGGKFPVQKAAAARAVSSSTAPRPSSAVGPTSPTKPPSSQSEQQLPDAQAQNGKGSSTAAMSQRPPSRPSSGTGTGTASSSTSRPAPASSSSTTIQAQASKSTSASLSPSKPTSSASTSAACQPADAAPPWKQPTSQNAAQSISPDPLAYAAGREKNALIAKDAATRPSGSKAVPRPPQPAPASTSNGLAIDAPRPADKPSSARSAAGVQPARPRPSSDGKTPRPVAQNGALVSSTAASSGKPVATTRAPSTASSSQPSKAIAGPTTTVDSDSDIEIIFPRAKSPAAPSRPASGSQIASTSRENDVTAQEIIATSGPDASMRVASATTNAVGRVADPSSAKVESGTPSTARFTPNVSKIATGGDNLGLSPQIDVRTAGEDRSASGGDLDAEDDELGSDEDGDDESIEAADLRLNKKRKKRRAHVKQDLVVSGGHQSRRTGATAEGDHAQKPGGTGEDHGRGEETSAAALEASSELSAAALLDAQYSPLGSGASGPRRLASLDEGPAAASIERLSRRLPSVEMTVEDLDKLKLSDSAATTDREQEQQKLRPSGVPAVLAAVRPAQQAAVAAVAEALAEHSTVEDIEMSDARPASKASEGESENGSKPSSTSNSPAPQPVQPRLGPLGRGRKSTGRRPPQAQIRSTQARRLAAELAAQRTAEQDLPRASVPGALNTSVPTTGVEERDGSAGSIAGGSVTPAASSTAPTSASLAQTFPVVGLGQHIAGVPMIDTEFAAASGDETTTGSEAPVRAFTTARKSYGRRPVIRSSPSVVSDSEMDSSSDLDSNAASDGADDADHVAEGWGQEQRALPERGSTLTDLIKVSTRNAPARKALAARKSYGPYPPRINSYSSPEVDEIESDRQADQAQGLSDLTDLSDSATDDSELDLRSRRERRVALARRAAQESYSAARARRQAGAAHALEASPTPLAANENTGGDELSRRASKLSVKEVEEDRQKSHLRRSRGSSATPSETQADEAQADETSTRARPSKRRRTNVADPASHSIDLVKLIREEQLPLILTPADVDREDPVALKEQRELIVKFKQREKTKQPWQRQICGPSYDFASEFHTEIQDAVNRREKRWAKLHPDELPIRSEYRAMFEAMIIEALSLEFPPLAIDARPKIRVCPPADLPPEAMPTPPFDFIYTNRVVYDEDIAPVQAPGCGCKGDCNSAENRKTCSCLARQIKACTTKVGGTDRSDHKDFAYDRQGRLKWRVFETHDQIIECNSMCGCGPECINRVVGNRKSISVDIFWTGIAGWGVRLPPSYPGHYQRTIKRGEPLAIYAGELLRSDDAYLRDDHVYSVIGRNYIYDLDAWTVMEDVESLLPRSTVADLKAKSPPPAESQIKTTQKNKGQKGKSKKITTLQELQLIEDSKAISPLYSMDAFNMGNWTRFCNHVCTDWNTMTRPVYIDEADLSRPLFVYFACRDIQPGEEICITYFGGDDDFEDNNLGYTDAEWKALADKARDEAPPGHRCYCGKKLCRGRMFDVHADELMFWQVRNA